MTSFSLFVLAEVEQMQKLVQTIRDDLQVCSLPSVYGLDYLISSATSLDLLYQSVHFECV